jgi:uracil-DNA glycosylase
VILGQDPYHNFGAAMGLAFSVPDGYKIQPSLKNIFKELKTDTGIGRTLTDLTDWASQGVFLLNSVLTVRSNLPASHQKK